MKHVFRIFLVPLLWVFPIAVLGAEVLPAGEFITLSPFIVEAKDYQSQFGGTGLLGMASGSPFQVEESLSEKLDWMLGVSLQRRGMHSLEPNIQGLGFDRVVTSLNGIYLPNTSPTHTGSPLNYFGATGQLMVNVIRSLPSVVLGPVPTGSRILLESIDSNPSTLTGRISIGSYDSRSGSATIRNRQEIMPFSLGVHFTQNGDYAGGGPKRVVDSDFRAWGVQFNGMLYVGANNATTISANYFQQQLSRNASLPLDTKKTPSLALTVNHSVDMEAGVLSIRCGYTRTNPFLTSEDRILSPNAPILLVESRGEASSYAFGGDWNTVIGQYFEFQTGMDGNWQERKMRRSRHLKNGFILEDLIWPEIEHAQVGVFAEIRSIGMGTLNWRFGTRLDRVSSKAGAVDGIVVGIPGARGDTIRENFISFHGPKATGVNSEEWNGSANGTLEFNLSDKLVLHGGIGFTVSSAGLGERYRAFVNALGGGVELGNPTLGAESKKEIHTGISWMAQRLKISATAFLMEIEDFVGREIVSESPLIFSYSNCDARFSGVHGAMEIILLEALNEDSKLSSRLTLPGSMSLTRGEDTRSGLQLPEVPPVEASLGLRYASQAYPLFDSCVMTLMCRYVAKATNPQPYLNPIFKDTEAYNLIDFELALNWLENWSLTFKISNLLDKEAFTYLQPTVVTGPIGPSSGNLAGGDPIPQPGRKFLLYLGFDY